MSNVDVVAADLVGLNQSVKKSVIFTTVATP